MRARIAAALALAAALAAAGCGGITTPSNNVTETFSGTLQPGTSNGHWFGVGKNGEFTVKLTAWAPNSNLLVGIGLFQGNGDHTCTNAQFQLNNFAAFNVQALGGAIVPAAYCIGIYDVGTLTAAQTCTITVSHP